MPGHVGGQPAGKQLCKTGSGCWWTPGGTEAINVPLRQRRATAALAAQGGTLPAKGGEPVPLVSTADTTSRVLCQFSATHRRQAQTY